MNLDLLKTATRVVVSLGSGAIVGTIVKNNLPDPTTINKITVPVSTFALGGVVGSKAGQYTDAFIDDIALVVEKIKTAKS